MSVEPTVIELRNFVTYRLSRLQSRLNAQAIRVLRKHSDLSLTEWRVIALVADQKKHTLSDMVRDTELDKGQLSRAIASLVAKKYIASQVNRNDQRQNLLQLTSSGEDVHGKLLPIMRRRQQSLIAEIEENDLDTTLRVLDQLEKASEGTPS